MGTELVRESRLWLIWQVLKDQCLTSHPLKILEILDFFERDDQPITCRGEGCSNEVAQTVAPN